MRGDYKNMLQWEECSSSEIESKPPASLDVVVVNTHVNPDELDDCSVPAQNEVYCGRIAATCALLADASRLLRDGGLLFVYGLPKMLPALAVWLNAHSDEECRLLFKYWIALELKADQSDRSLPHAHLGLLMYLKTKSLRSPTPFALNTKTVRIPYTNCPACGEVTKDWGGKKHLINRLGSAVSDVWSVLDTHIRDAASIPQVCLQRIFDLTRHPGSRMLVIRQEALPDYPVPRGSAAGRSVSRPPSRDDVLHADSLELMREYARKYPDGLFDLAFADPPYNLAKNYNAYTDQQADADYIAWCNEWLGLICEVLRPGGALVVLNIPKWAIYHADFLNFRMEFRNWIVWNALSTPSGKLLPAHYALLYYTKPGGAPTLAYDTVGQIDSREYCLRATCVNRRKESGDDRKELLSDVWHDIHRIKHRRDRDPHPCQLPIRLLQRIIELTTRPGDWVYDPFGGAGTTAIAARISGRRFVISDIDPIYQEIAESNLNRIGELLNGEKILVRKSVRRSSNGIPRREIEMAYISRCKAMGRVLAIEDLKETDTELYERIRQHYRDIKYLRKITRRQLENETLIEHL
ncbi:MAG: DNA methyltransferase [Methanomicrobiaceae archaeon]|nr:DNA methyltransferase [Methanomicrobiaceae archaeon]